MRKAAEPIVREVELKMAMGDAVTRAVYKAPASLLKEFRGDQLKRACRRLAIHVAEELRGDGWRQRGLKMGDTDTEMWEAIAAGLFKAGPPILRSLPYAQACDHKCDKELLEGIGADLGERALRAMRAADITIERRC
jgi:hypothetical protein